MTKNIRKQSLNYYKRVLAVQEIYKEHTALVSNEKIYTEFVFPRFFISRSTFYDYLSVPAKARIKELENDQSNKGTSGGP